MKIRMRENAVDILVAAIILIAVSPMVYYGKDSILTIHDNLDSTIGWIKMMKDSGNLFAFDSPTPVLGGMSTLYFLQEYNIMLFIYAFLDVFEAFLICYILKILVGYFAMKLFLTSIFTLSENSTLIKLISLGFALTPLIPQWGIIIESIPLLCYFFIEIKKIETKRIDLRVFLLALYPLLSSLVTIGFALLGLWALGIIVFWIKQKKIHRNLVVGLFSLSAGYVIVSIKLFYAVFFIDEPLNRAITSSTLSLREAFSPDRLVTSYIVGGYHAPLLLRWVVFCTVYLSLFAVVVLIIFGLARDKWKISYRYMANYALTAGIFCGLTVFFSLCGNAYDSEIITDFISTVFPFLHGFNWGRVRFLNRIIFVIWFAYTLIVFNGMKNKRFTRLCLNIVACLQIVVVMTYPSYYSYSYFNLNYDKTVQRDDMLTFNEFYSESLFDKIKQDIDYKGEISAALGYHPSILMYNGISTMDGYNNSYPLAYLHAFREVIAPQLEANPEDKHYYDSWGGRMYLYNDEVDYNPTRVRQTNPVKLLINADAFRQLGGIYIFSRAEILNADSLQMSLIKEYEDRISPYQIYVYRTL